MGAPGPARRSFPAGSSLRSGALRFATLALLWTALTEGDLGTAWLGFLAILAATLSSLVLLPPSGAHWSVAGAARFAGFFFRRSLAGGVDVALRALRPALDLNPALVEYEMRLPAGGARVVLANTVSLLPGTLSAEVRGGRLLVHTLDAAPGLREELRRAEQAVSGLLGVELHGEIPTGERE